MDRKINLLVVHCSATPVTMDIGVKEIRSWHKAKGWSDIGYHYVIRLDGTLELGRDLDGDGDVQDEVGAHAYGFNRNSLGVCLIGGSDKDLKPLKTITPEQEKALVNLIIKLEWSSLSFDIKGHNELSNKACPSFNVQDWLKEKGYKKN